MSTSWLLCWKRGIVGLASRRCQDAAAQGLGHPQQRLRDAAHKLSEALKQANPEIPWDDIYAARNVVVHFYFGVNQKILWDILQEDLDPLMKKGQERSIPSPAMRLLNAAP